MVHIIDGALPVYSEHDALIVRQVGSESRIDRIIASGSGFTPPASMFGPEPARGWCYYYQKASLARQQGNWAEIGRIYDEVTAQKLKPGDQSEWIPFVEGLVNAGREAEARAIYKQEIKGRDQVRFPLCLSLAKDPGYPPGYGYDYEKIKTILCGE